MFDSRLPRGMWSEPGIEPCSNSSVHARRARRCPASTGARPPWRCPPLEFAASSRGASRGSSPCIDLSGFGPRTRAQNVTCAVNNRVQPEIPGCEDAAPDANPHHHRAVPRLEVPEVTGGVENRVYYVVRRLRARHDVTVLAGETQGGTQWRPASVRSIPMRLRRMAKILWRGLHADSMSSRARSWWCIRSRSCSAGSSASRSCSGTPTC